MNLLNIFKSVIPSVTSIVAKAVPDKDLARRLTHEIQSLLIGLHPSSPYIVLPLYQVRH